MKWITHDLIHGLRTPREEIAFTARPKIHSHSQIFRYCGSIFCLPHRPNFSDIFDLCLHWVSVVRELSLGVNIKNPRYSFILFVVLKVNLISRTMSNLTKTSYGTIVFLYKNFLMQRKKFTDNNLFSKFGDLTSTIISFGKQTRLSTDKSCLSVCT